MAWYTIEHSCGHVVERRIGLTGVLGERERIAEELARRPCGGCGRRERAAAETVAMEAAEAEYGWPLPAGSEPQVTWARQIRHRAAAEVVAWERGVHPGRAAVVLPLLLGVMARQEEASWWIEHRDADWTAMLREVLDERERAVLEDAGGAG